MRIKVETALIGGKRKKKTAEAEGEEVAVEAEEEEAGLVRVRLIGEDAAVLHLSALHQGEGVASLQVDVEAEGVMIFEEMIASPEVGGVAVEVEGVVGCAVE